MHINDITDFQGKTLAIDGEGTVYCAWFARCENPATANEPHPVLGQVPICARCAEQAHA